jgi:hypothetical protein
LEARIARLSDDLELERGGKATLRQQLDEAKQQLATLQPKGDEAPQALVKPKRPTKAEFDFDEGQYDAALEKYDQDVDAYYTALSAKTTADTIAQKEAERQEREVKAAEQRAAAEFSSRMDADKADIEDYDDYVGSLGEQVLPGAVVGYIQEAEHPAMLLYHFMKDAVDEGGKDLARITALSPVMQVRELTKLEEKMTAKPAEAPEPATPTPPTKKPEKSPETVPVRPKPVVQVPDEPIRPVGSRALPSMDHLSSAGSAAAYIRMRQAGVNRP